MLAVPGILAVEALGKGPWWEAPFKVTHTLLSGRNLMLISAESHDAVLP
jgi:hypothetical protein